MFYKIDINTLLLNRMSSKPGNTKETFVGFTLWNIS